MEGVSTVSAVTKPASSGPSQASQTQNNQPPQEVVNRFWKSFNSRYPGKVFNVLPREKSKPLSTPTDVAHGQKAVKSYEEAKRECEHAVSRIVKECLRGNQKYTDSHFDIELDLKSGTRNCLDVLSAQNPEMTPKGVKRVTDIFENPQFYVNDATAGDVRQGRDGDCWLMAALCTLGNKEGLIDKVCVARNEQVGVYGFVFHRDGEWRHTIIDDKLYLRVPDYEEALGERQLWDELGRPDTEDKYRKTWQTGSRALYFAQCSDENETWLPLLEKAYAKAHGDYSSIEGGFVGEAIEDLTGGVTSEIMTSNILDKEKFWTEDLMNVNKQFLFGCATGLYSHWLYPAYYDFPRERSGIHEAHAYSIMDAREIKGERLLRLRNPWGMKEWNGPWSDGSEQWTPEWMTLLDHKFGNDGMFWISYKDFLNKYEHLDRTRLFGPEWTVTQKWTSLQVPWSSAYHSTKFAIELSETGSVVIVLSQLDDRYFRGLEGHYDFQLQFRVEKDGEEDYIVRNHKNSYMSRSVSADITLEAGKYFVLVKITASRKNSESAEEVIKKNASSRREKLVQIGRAYDLAHAKAHEPETEKEEEERKEREAAKKVIKRQKLREKTEERLRKEWSRKKKLAARAKRAELKVSRAKANRDAKSKAGSERWSHRSELPDGIPPQAPEGQSTEDRAGVQSLPSTVQGSLRELEVIVNPAEKLDESKLEDLEPEGSGDAMNPAVEPSELKPERTNAGEGNVQDTLLGELKPEKPNPTEPAGDEIEKSKLEDMESESSRGNILPVDDSKVDPINDAKGNDDDAGFDATDKSDTDSFCDFEFDSEIDMTPEEETESEIDGALGSGESDDESPDSNRWNAVCVMGLRVYSKDQNVSLHVIKPINEEEDVTPPRDCDDPAVSAMKSSS